MNSDSVVWLNHFESFNFILPNHKTDHFPINYWTNDKGYHDWCNPTELSKTMSHADKLRNITSARTLL